MTRINAKATGLALESELQGAFAHGVWLGKLRKLNANGTESLHLELDSPTDVLVSADRSRVEWFCLNGKPARVCADADWAADKWSANVNANDLPISTLTSGLTPSVDYRGTAHHHRRVRLAAEARQCRECCARISSMLPSRTSWPADARSASRSAPGSSM